MDSKKARPKPASIKATSVESSEGVCTGRHSTYCNYICSLYIWRVHALALYRKLKNFEEIYHRRICTNKLKRRGGLPVFGGKCLFQKAVKSGILSIYGQGNFKGGGA